MRIATTAIAIVCLIATSVGAGAQDGTLDPTFGGTGVILRLPPNGGAAGTPALVVQPDGRLVVAGRTFNVGQNGWNSFFARMFTNGAMDATFSGDGYAGFDLAEAFVDDALNAVALLPDGRLLGAGILNRSFVVTRVNANGTLDLTFGPTDGVAIIPVAGGVGHSYATSLIVTSAGYVAAGPAGRVFASATGAFGVARVTPDGDQDPAFNGGSAVTIDITEQMDDAVGVIEMSDGKLLVAGTAGSTGIGDGIAGLARLLPDGSLDTTFLGSGFGTVDLAPGPETIKALAAGPAGTFYLGGSGGSDGVMLVARLHADGSLDATFGTDGSIAIPLPGDNAWGSANSILVQPDGKVILAGQSSDGIALVRLHPDGTLDDAFGTGGITTVPIWNEAIGVYGGYAEAIGLQAGARIFVAGSTVCDFDSCRFLTAAFRNAFTSDDEPGSPPSIPLSISIVPNPASAGATARIELASASAVRAAAFDALGREVVVIHDGVLAAGVHALPFEAGRLAAGTYVIRVDSAGYVVTARMSVVR